MLEIQVAGAGAGKTYGLSKKIIEKINNSKSQKKIFALTYTNAAKTKIESEVIKQNGTIPENVSIETVHSFLLNEIIFPFSNFILGDKYNKSSIIFLGNDFKYKACKVKKLKDQGVIHVDKAYIVSRQIVDREDCKNNTIKKKLKVDTVNSLLNQCIDSIFIDEVQDLDSNALRVFEVLGSTNIFTYMIGDPKQAIKWPDNFTNFVKQVENYNSGLVQVLEPNNITRRVPENILLQSNRFCYKDQVQKSISDVVGSVKYIESISNEYESFIKKHISGKSIVCIDKKCDEYSTGIDSQYCFPLTIENKIICSNHKKDDELLLRAAYAEFCQNSASTKNLAVSKLVEKFDLTLDKAEYAQLFELRDKVGQSPLKYNISSIDAVKGLEADTCVLILTPNTFKYFIQKDLKTKQIFNKEWKKLYVVLTRAKYELILAVDHNLFKDYNIENIKRELEKFGVNAFD